MPILLSKASKMPCKSWSLQAGTTCPGSINPDTRKVIEVCTDCYAKSRFYKMDNVRLPREHNRKDWKRIDWADDMVTALSKEEYFRWFDSGDIYTAALAQKIYEVCRRTPHVKHWIPTKSYQIPKIRYWLDRIKSLPNVMVRFSSPSTHGFAGPEHGSTVTQEVSDVLAPEIKDSRSTAFCEAYKNNGKCMDCRACWDKSLSLIIYPLHTPRKKININRVKSVKSVA